ncbi:MAG: hypothetical protein N2506_00300 [Dehalococcoidales bacterium]|nr:hypothetical protein [Dehalococcoidales bacterium]
MEDQDRQRNPAIGSQVTLDTILIQAIVKLEMRQMVPLSRQSQIYTVSTWGSGQIHFNGNYTQWRDLLDRLDKAAGDLDMDWTVTTFETHPENVLPLDDGIEARDCGGTVKIIIGGATYNVTDIVDQLIPMSAGSIALYRAVELGLEYHPIIDSICRLLRRRR